MRLGDILNKLSRKRKSTDLLNRNKRPAEDIYKPIEHQIADDSRFKKIGEQITTEQGRKNTTEVERIRKRNKFMILGISMVAMMIFVALLGVIYVRITNSAFNENKVNIKIIGPDKVLIGEEVEYEIIVENNNRVNIDNVVVGLNFPDNFELQENSFVVDKNLSGARIEVGEMKKNSQKKYKIKIQVGYASDSKVLVKTFVRYIPNNVSSFFQSSVSKSVYLSRPAINVAIFSAENISSGELVELVMNVKNDTAKMYKDLILKIEYPEGFVFGDSTMKSMNKENNLWVIDKLESGEQKELKIQGRLSGRVDSIKKFKISVFKKGLEKSIVFNGEKNIKIIPSKIILKQEVSSRSVYPGAFVDYKISFKNNSAVNLRDLILKVHLPDKFIKNDTIRYDNGYYDSRHNVIIWKASDVEKLRNLQSGEEGSVDFSMRIKENILPNDNENSNPYIKVYSEIESLDIDSPIFENKRVISYQTKTLINSKVSVDSSIVYSTEDNGGMEAEYLRVDKEIFLRVNLKIKNTTNKLKNVELIVNFPSGVLWKRQIYPEGDNLEFNNRSNQMKWNIGLVKEGTGFILPAENAEFLISTIPSTNQIGHEIDLIKNIQINANDIFTGNTIEYKSKVIRSSAIKGLKGGGVVIEGNNRENN